MAPPQKPEMEEQREGYGFDEGIFREQKEEFLREGNSLPFVPHRSKKEWIENRKCSNEHNFHISMEVNLTPPYLYFLHFVIYLV